MAAVWVFDRMVGQTLGRYRILEKIGTGGMGEVYRARDEQLRRDVAVKVLRADILADDHARKRFRREAELLSKLNHPHVAQVYDFGSHEGVDFLVMEEVPGESLKDKLDRGSLPEKEVVHLGGQIAEALQEAHEQGIVHRDLKPGNVKLTAKGQAKVLDFGIAQLVQPATEGATQTFTEINRETNSLAGTLPYMAPEQLRGEDTDTRSDIYSLGVVLYEMATARRPFDAKLHTALSDAILHQAPAPPRTVDRRVSTGLEDIILKCLEKERERRYQSAAELKIDMDRVGAGMAAARARVRPSLRSLALAAFGGLALGALLVGLNVGGLRTQLLGGRGTPQIRSLAVLPFDNLSGDSEQDYFTDGMTDALITDIGRLGGLNRVIARSSVMRYRNTDKLPSQIARELRVDVILTGAVLRSGDRVRITAQLVNPATDEQLWAERYDRHLRDVLTLQNEVVGAIATAIQLHLTPAEETHLAHSRQVSPEAYEFYLRGRFHLDKRTREGLKKGLEYFQAAIDADPGYALGYVGLADAYRTFASYAEMPPTEAYPRAKAALARALEIDDTIAEAHLSLASSHFDDFEWEAAEREFLRALELNPNYATTHHWYAVYLGASGRHEEAMKEIERASELDPLSPVIRGAAMGILFHARRYDETIDEAERLPDLKPPFRYFHVGSAYLEKGMHDEGVAEFEQEAAVSPSPTVKARLGYAYARANRRDEALRVLHELQEGSERQEVSSYEIALLHAGLGDKTQSVAWLEKAYEAREGVMWLHFLEVSPCFDGVRDAGRFQELVRRMNFPP